MTDGVSGRRKKNNKANVYRRSGSLGTLSMQSEEGIKQLEIFNCHESGLKNCSKSLKRITKSFIELNKAQKEFQLARTSYQESIENHFPKSIYKSFLAEMIDFQSKIYQIEQARLYETKVISDIFDDWVKNYMKPISDKRLTEKVEQSENQTPISYKDYVQLQKVNKGSELCFSEQIISQFDNQRRAYLEGLAAINEMIPKLQFYNSTLSILRDDPSIIEEEIIRRHKDNKRTLGLSLDELMKRELAKLQILEPFSSNEVPTELHQPFYHRIDLSDGYLVDEASFIPSFVWKITGVIIRKTNPSTDFSNEAQRLAMLDHEFEKALLNFDDLNEQEAMGLFILWLKNLPQPLVVKEIASENPNVANIKEKLDNFDKITLHTLKRIIWMCFTLQGQGFNLTPVLTPAIFQFYDEDPKLQPFFEYLTTNYTQIFIEKLAKQPQQGQQSQQSSPRSQSQQPSPRSQPEQSQPQQLQQTELEQMFSKKGTAKRRKSMTKPRLGHVKFKSTSGHDKLKLSSSDAGIVAHKRETSEPALNSPKDEKNSHQTNESESKVKFSSRGDTSKESHGSKRDKSGEDNSMSQPINSDENRLAASPSVSFRSNRLSVTLDKLTDFSRWQIFSSFEVLRSPLQMNLASSKLASFLSSVFSDSLDISNIEASIKEVVGYMSRFVTHCFATFSVNKLTISDINQELLTDGDHQDPELWLNKLNKLSSKNNTLWNTEKIDVVRNILYQIQDDIRQLIHSITPITTVKSTNKSQIQKQLIITLFKMTKHLNLFIYEFEEIITSQVGSLIEICISDAVKTVNLISQNSSSTGISNFQLLKTIIHRIAIYSSFISNIMNNDEIVLPHVASLISQSEKLILSLASTNQSSWNLSNLNPLVPLRDQDPWIKASQSILLELYYLSIVYRTSCKKDSSIKPAAPLIDKTQNILKDLTKIAVGQTEKSFEKAIIEPTNTLLEEIKKWNLPKSKTTVFELGDTNTTNINLTPAIIIQSSLKITSAMNEITESIQNSAIFPHNVVDSPDFLSVTVALNGHISQEIKFLIQICYSTLLLSGDIPDEILDRKEMQLLGDSLVSQLKTFLMESHLRSLRQIFSKHFIN